MIMIISFVFYSRQSTVVAGILHDGQERIILDVKVVFVIVEKFILLDAFYLDTLQTEMAGCWVLFACVERVEVHAIDQRAGFMHLLFAAEKVHS